MFCPRCGAESPDDVRYCAACGAELPRASATEPGGDGTITSRIAGRLRRLVGRNRRERVISGLTVGLLVVAVLAFLSLDPPEDEQVMADREALDAGCVAAKAQVVEAGNALAGPGGPEQYALLVVVAMMDLRDAAAESGLSGVDELRSAALDAAVAAGRVGRLSREPSPATPLDEAVQESVEALDALSAPTEDLGLATCTDASIEQVG